MIGFSLLSTLVVRSRCYGLVDFDNGDGYFGLQYPEASLEYFQGYTEGFAGRIRLFLICMVKKRFSNDSFLEELG